MFFTNLLIKNIFYKKRRFAPIWAKAAPRLAYSDFSSAHAQGYPQEWWITHTAPYAAGVGKKGASPG
ncbi:hypothetical protein CYR55_19455 [Chimaeribacter californicus]|uniref:Uncharacterized protein n=1 Tax=Chimaeribacter californicus TaxID=2060067 RepID=A0A2N5DXH7_9GAMM|nr:hypothetical protein CYR55_19455 [Chimaeribacter californicus]